LGTGGFSGIVPDWNGFTTGVGAEVVTEGELAVSAAGVEIKERKEVRGEDVGLGGFPKRTERSGTVLSTSWVATPVLE
jgi:hypothetical protein